MQNPIYTPPEGPPKSPQPSKEIYLRMGKDNFYALAKDFYTHLSHSSIKDLFPKDNKTLILASQKTAEFLIQLCGGPPLYEAKHGPPQMRRKHLAFKIDRTAQEEWLRCLFTTLDQAVKNYQFPEEHLPSFKQYMSELSRWMINSQ